MKFQLELGPCPCDENCIQVGEANYVERAISECREYIKLIRKVHGKEPAGAKLKVKSFPHDFGTYYEVICEYDEKDESVEYAYKCEANLPEKWEVV